MQQETISNRPRQPTPVAPTRRGSPFFWVFAFLVPFLGTGMALRIFGGHSAARGDLSNRLSEIEAQLAESRTPRSAPPVFVLDPTETGAPASLASAVAELSRQVAQLQARAGDTNGGMDAVGEMLASDDPGQRRKGLRSLRELAKTDPAALASLKSLLADGDAQVRRDAIGALQDLENPAHIPDVKALLTDSDPRVRGRAAVALADMAENATDPAVKAAAVSDLGQMLSDSDRNTRRDAVRALQDIGGKEVTASLVKALGDKDFEVQGEAIRSLAEAGDPVAAAALRQAYGDGSGPNALDAALALKKTGDGSAFAREQARLQALATGNASPDDRRRAMAILAENMPPEQVRPLLEQALRDPSDRVRRDARRALDELASR